MENYAKVILYTYPLLKTVGQDYEEHIRNKALLSYDSPLTAERLAEYIADEILCMDRLEWLKGVLDEVLEKLDEEERALLEIRYFGKRKKIRRFLPLRRAAEGERTASGWSEGKYFRRQHRLGEKVGAMLKSMGVTKEVYDRDFAGVDIFRRIHRFVDDGKDRKISSDERRWMGG